MSVERIEELVKRLNDEMDDEQTIANFFAKEFDISEEEAALLLTKWGNIIMANNAVNTFFGAVVDPAECLGTAAGFYYILGKEKGKQEAFAKYMEDR